MTRLRQTVPLARLSRADALVVRYLRVKLYLATSGRVISDARLEALHRLKARLRAATLDAIADEGRR